MLTFDLEKETSTMGTALADILKKVEESRGEYEEQAKEWEAHLKGLKKVSLMKSLEKMGVKLTTNRRGWECLAVGDPIKQLSELATPTSTGLSVISKIAAGRYKALEPGAHLKWFDPRKNRQSIFAAFFEGSWHFFDWKRNKGLTPARDIPFKTWKRMVNFHETIDLLLDAPDIHAFQVTLNLDEDRALYQTLIHSHLEDTLEDYEEFVKKNDEEAAEQVRANSGTASGTVIPQEVVEKRNNFIEQHLDGLTTKAKITLVSPFKTVAVMWFDPAKRDQVYASIRGYAPNYEFTNVELAD